VTAVRELSDRHGLDAAAAERLTALTDLVAADPTAPTSVREREAAIDAHLADSLVALELDAVRSARAIADVGAGAGFPGIPLAVALPDARVWLVESVGRKCAFLERAVAAAGAGNARVVCERAEVWSEGREYCDLVVARAVGPLAVLAEYAAPLLALGGTLVAWKGRRNESEERAAAAAADELGLEPVEVRGVEPYPAARSRHLHVYSKVRPTPARFPRRPGAARKRPLGAG
jgi:16S rRNA (guanine527-N7)-methyltransferase